MREIMLRRYTSASRTFSEWQKKKGTDCVFSKYEGGSGLWYLKKKKN